MSVPQFAGFVAAWLFSACMVAIVAGRFFAVANPQQLRRSNEEQPLRDVHPQLLGSLPVGGQVNNLDHIVGDTDAAA